jgi:hypothetical protein
VIDQGALDEHYRSQEFAHYQAEIADQLVRVSDLCVHFVHESFQPVASPAIDTSPDD